jgi:peroxiredoxin
LIILGAAALAYLFWNQVEASSLPGGFESAIPITVDYRAPKLELKDINGKSASLADYAGQVVLVNNWAFWCPPCRAELPILESYYQDHRAQGFTIIGIESGGSAETVRQYIDGYHLTYPIWLDPRIKAVATFNNRSLPNSFVIDGDGQVRLAWTGPVSREMLETYVTPLLEE